MQICPACRRESPDEFRHCPYCGAALVAPAIERRKLATLVFCDVVGSTSMSEQTDPEAVRALMLAYFGEAREVLERHGGTVEKFIGDAVVAAFGVPVAHEDDALRACRAALEIQSRLSTRIALRIGVNTGEVVAGDTAARETFVTGDAVNVAARLEQATASGEVLIGESTYRLVRDAASVEAVQPVAAKGKSESLEAYRLLAVGGAVTRRGSPLVGRGAELDLLEREVQAVLEEQRCRLLTVVGEPGVGKSRLAAELVDRLGSRARIVRGTCISYGEGITFWAVAQIVRELAAIRDDHTAEDARERLGPRLAQLLGLAEGTSTADQMSEAIAQFLSAAAVERPLVVFVDDIQWAEPALLDLLAALPALIGTAPIAVICLARPELLEARSDWPVAVPLGPLGVGDVDALLESLHAPTAARVRLAQAAAGNPLFAEELVAWAQEGGDIDALPTSLTALLGARLDRLETQARDVLERGAIEGELFHRGAVVALSEAESRPLVSGGLADLAGNDMIRPAAASFAGEVAFRFKHILVREAAYRATAKRLRASLHEQFGDWLERLAGERVGEFQEILGYHFEQAYRYRAELGDRDEVLTGRAARHLGAAGRRANDRGDVYAAANLLGRAIALLPADSLERLELLLPYGYALHESGRSVENLAVNEELYERATALGEQGLATHALGRRRGSEIISDPARDLDEARAINEEAIETFTELGDEAGVAQAMRRLGLICRVQAREAEATDWLERALVHANACGDLTTRRMITQSLAMTLCGGPMPVGEAAARCEELREANRDDRILDAVIVRCLAELSAMAGRFDEARDHDRRSSLVLDRANMRTPTRVSQANAASTREILGDRAGAERELKAKLLFMRDEAGGMSEGRGMGTACILANFYCDEGRWAEAEECLALYRGVLAPDAIKTAATTLAVQARLAAHHGEPDEGVTLAQRAVELTETTDALDLRARIWLALAEVQQAAGHAAEAADAVAAALALYEEKGNVAAADRLRAGLPNA